MKVILSRKGFDSSFGGYPSPILPDGTLLSIPIPDPDCKTKYSQLSFDKERTYYDIMETLYKPNFSSNSTCHYDPELMRGPQKRSKNWRGLLGQLNSAQSHLERQNIKCGDLFLFFGWFKETEIYDGILRFKIKASDLHLIFGYLQIGGIIKISKDPIPAWITSHPHIETNKYLSKPTNTLYFATDILSFKKKLEGFGTFNYSERLVLTKQGLSRSKWSLPKQFKNIKISYHSSSSWKDGYFQSANIGQEFVFEENGIVEEWAKQIFLE